MLLLEEFEAQVSMLLGVNVKLKITRMTDPNESDPVAERILITNVKRAVCAVFDINQDQLTSQTKTQQLSDARFIAYKVIKDKLPKTSLKTIGAAFGDRDHTTVIHGLQTFKKYHDTEEAFRKQYSKVVETLKEYVL